MSYSERCRFCSTVNSVAFLVMGMLSRSSKHVISWSENYAPPCKTTLRQRVLVELSKCKMNGTRNISFFSCMLQTILYIYSICILRCNKKYLSYTTATIIMVWANPRPSEGCAWMVSQHELNLKFLLEHADVFGDRCTTPCQGGPQVR